MIIILLLLWIILSGQNSIFFAISACCSVLIVVLIDKKLFTSSPIFLKFDLCWFSFTRNLFKEMFLSTIMLLKIIWLNPKQVKPVYQLIDAQSKNSVTQAIQANCITLTPGTMSMDLQNNKILIHAISDEAMQNIYSIPEVTK